MTHAMQPEWIAVENFKTHQQVYVFGADDALLAQHKLCSTDQSPVDQLTQFLEDQNINPHIPIFVSGMPSTYVSTPCSVPSGDETLRAGSSKWALYPLAGIRQDAPIDVMTHDVTKISGYLAQDKDFDGVLMIPGAQSKWVHISAEEIVSFRSFMTGEQFDLFAQHSSLHEGLQGQDVDHSEFDTALSETLSRPESVAAKISSLGAEILLNELPSNKARARLLAYLIGAELAASRPYWLGQQVVILGLSGSAQCYQRALEAQGAMVRCVDDEPLLLAGFRVAYEDIKSKS